jgi:putative oxidoreductase
MSDETLTTAGKLLLRCVLAVLMLFHGVHKVVHGIDGIREILAVRGLPTFIAPGVYIGEVVAPLLMIAGVYARPAALVFSFNMVIAVATDHPHQLFTLGRSGNYALELQALFLVGGLVVAMMGPGRWTLATVARNARNDGRARRQLDHPRN